MTQFTRDLESVGLIRWGSGFVIKEDVMSAEVIPHNLREYVCTKCREINLLQSKENEKIRPCDDCKSVGSLVPIEKI